MSKNRKQEEHPLINVNIPNTFYFTLNKPEQHNAVDYSKTFADIHSSKKEVLHGYWKVVLDILAECVRIYQSHDQRRRSEWNIPSKDLGDFRRRLEGKESIQDQMQSTTSILKKRAIRSVQRNTLKAYHAVDRNFGFGDDDAESNPGRQWRKSAMKDDGQILGTLECVVTAFTNNSEAHAHNLLPGRQWGS
ncbi:hypothetical protein BGX34_011816 [Mortierella sp. NVP85]|nr:hypothetical protein BGX34_011816 [Mortierella sp. NVP85]